jgi:hypothetical protein
MTDISVPRNKPGRPRAIPEDQIDEVISMYKSGLGYRAIAHELEKHGVFADWTTVRRIIKKWQREKSLYNGPCLNCTTILPRGD